MNRTHEEFAELITEHLPSASLDALKEIRKTTCTTSEFKLSTPQRFLRRVLSPDAPTQCMLLVHGTGVGKTCTAIQVAEEYILRPEYQRKKVLVLANRAVQENFATQVFDMNRVSFDEHRKALSSRQCSGRRYLDMLLRAEAIPKNWENPTTRETLTKLASKLVHEYYDPLGYITFGNRISEMTDEQIHAEYDNRLIIIDEAHNIRDVSAEEGETEQKIVSNGIQKLAKVASGVILVLLTATPMFDSYSEIIFFMNLFGWTTRTRKPTEVYKVNEFFTPEATFVSPKAEQMFRDWCQHHVSYVKGESPFTFPFRLPPPEIAEPLPNTIPGFGKSNRTPIQYLSLVASEVQGLQKTELEKNQANMANTICVLPENSLIRAGTSYSYAGDALFTPEQLPNYSAKFASILQTLQHSKGTVLIYSNLVRGGVDLMAIALEEHGYTSYSKKPRLTNPAYKGDSKGVYCVLSGDMQPRELRDTLAVIKSNENLDGSRIRILLTSPLVSEGVDFRAVRQVHILDPWWNMSRIDQVIGRALRTCSHASLPHEEQNCSVYLHIVRNGTQETYDEYTYRTHVEQKGILIAKVRKYIAESAMDCPSQNQINRLPEDWKKLEVPQSMSEEGHKIHLPLYEMMAPTFHESADVDTCLVRTDKTDKDHVRPLSSYMDVREDILHHLETLFLQKPIWDRTQLLQACHPFSEKVVVFTLQYAIRSGYAFTDAFGRKSRLDSNKHLYSLLPLNASDTTFVSRTTLPPEVRSLPLPVGEKPVETDTTMEYELLSERLASDKLLTPEIRTRFDETILRKHVFDTKFSIQEQVQYTEQFKESAPYYEKHVLPSGRIMSPDRKDSIGAEKDEEQAWLDALLQRFASDTKTLFAMNTPSVSISPYELKEGIPTRIVRSKTVLPIVCSTGIIQSNTVLRPLSAYIDSRNVGASGTVKYVCLWIDLLAREEHNIKWYTAIEAHYIKENEKVLRKKMKQ